VLKKMLERLLDVKVTAHGTIIEEVEISYPMTGFRMRLLMEHFADGSYRTLELRSA
jgi:hypothetical protein